MERYDVIASFYVVFQIKSDVCRFMKTPVMTINSRQERERDTGPG